MPKISQFPSGGLAQNTDLIPIVRNGGDYTITGYNLASLASYGQAYVGTFTATAGQTVFTLPASPGSLANLAISVDGAVMVPGTDYTWTTPTTLTFTSGLSNGQTVLYRYTSSVPVGTAIAGGVNGQLLYNNSGVVNGFTMSGDVTVVPTTGVATVNAPSSHITYTQGGTGATSRTVTSKLQESVSVLDFGADPTGSSDSTTAINNAIATGKHIYFPSGKYVISSTVTGSTGAWIGDGSGDVYDSTWNAGTTMFVLSGTNSGNAFLFPPSVFQGIHVNGSSTATIGIQVGQNNGTFVGFLKWRDITVRQCVLGMQMYNWYMGDFSDITIAGNTNGIRISPTVTTPDGGYFTSTSWKDIYIGFNTGYGLYVSLPLSSRSWNWTNVVIEDNATSGPYQAYLQNVNATIRGLYCEATSGYPVISTNNCTLHVTYGFFNGTGGWDATSNALTLVLDEVNFATASDVFLNLASTAKIYANNSTIQTDLRSAGSTTLGGLVNTTTGGVLVNNRPKVLSLGGPSVDGQYPSDLTNDWTYTTTVTSTVAAGATNVVVTNKYLYNLWTGGVLGVANVNGYYPGLIASVTPGNTGSPHYFCVTLTNTTASSITLTGVGISVGFIKSNATAF